MMKPLGHVFIVLPFGPLAPLLPLPPGPLPHRSVVKPEPESIVREGTGQGKGEGEEKGREVERGSKGWGGR